MARKLYTREYWLNKISKAKTPADKRRLIKQFEKWENKNKDLTKLESEIKKIEKKVEKYNI